MFKHRRLPQSDSSHKEKPLRVLLVDDDYQLLNVLALWLDAEGLDVMTAIDGEQALSVVDHQRPDLVVADVVMPRMGGVRLARALRDKSIPVILTSATNQPHNIDPDVPFLSKPFDLVDLSDAITRLLRMSRTTAAN